jgi:hypothetical protein
MPNKGQLKYTQEELETRIDQYFLRCHEQDKRVTWLGWRCTWASQQRP